MQTVGRDKRVLEGCDGDQGYDELAGVLQVEPAQVGAGLDGQMKESDSVVRKKSGRDRRLLIITT
jgi:hypothetical protein